MKSNNKRRIKFLAIMFGVFVMITSCEYQQIANADYPDQLIYLPAANFSPYAIDRVPEVRGSSPTPGYAVRFLTDTVARRLDVLLGVYRSGIDNKGSFKVNVSANIDTITSLIASGGLPTGTQLLPSTEYEMVSSVNMNDGEELAKFELSVDLDFLKNSYPSEKFALGISVSSNERETNPALETVIVLIDTKIMKPTPSFTSEASATKSKTINFTNTSIGGTKFTWDFGDGSPIVTTTMVSEAVSHTYSSLGAYAVTLTAQGITGYADRSVLNQTQDVLPSAPIRTTVNDNDPSVIYVGSSWNHNAETGCYNNDRSYSNTKGDYFTYGFTGDKVELYFKTGSAYGTIDVYLDDVQVGSGVTLATSSTLYQQKVFEASCANGAHTLKVVIGTTGKYSIFDYLVFSAPNPINN